MTNPVGIKLARLIRERSYLSGEIARLEESAQRVERDIAAARIRLKTLRSVELAKAQQRLTEVDRLIQEDAPGIDPNDINVVRRTPRQTTGAHGNLIGAVIEILQSTTKGVSTIEVAQRIAPQFGMPWETANDRDYSVSRVRRILNNLKTRGAVERLSSTTTEHNQAVARWRWCAD